MPELSLTIHAAEITFERCTTPAQEILWRLEQNLGFPVGTEPGTNRTHELLYLPEDAQHFALIRDTRTQEIITCLPVDYHVNCAWKISQSAMNRARKLSKKYKQPKPDEPIQADPKDFFSSMIRVMYKTHRSLRKTISLGTHPLPQVNPVEAFQNNKSLRKQIREKLIAKNIALTSVTGVLVQKKPDGDFERFSMDILELG